MYSIAFDTSARSCSIALFKDFEKLSAFEKTMDFGQGEALIPEMETLLKSSRLKFKDIGLITVCTGPGSFTGVRAGIAAARAFGLVSDKLTICGVNAFDAYTLGFENPAEVNAVIIETKREDFYYQLFDKNLGKISEPLAGNREEIIALLKGKTVSFTGDGTERFLFHPTGLAIKHIDMPDALPIEKLARLGIRRYTDGTCLFPQPLYIRAPDICGKK